MARKPDTDKLEQIYRAIQQNPGHTAGYIARLVGLHRSDVTRALPNLDENGMFTSEDEYGRLWAVLRNPKNQE